ncbi:MAG: DUF4203 domain-containing protein [Baekduia sp.]
MRDVIFALLAIAAGALFCFRGNLAFRIVIPIWGAFVGFATGAALVASLGGDGFLSTATGWFVGFGLAVVFGALAYLFYAVSVVIAMASIGFSLGASAMLAIGVSWTWVAVLVGLAFAVLLAYTAIVSDLPMVLLTVLSAMAGASAITTGVMVLVDEISTRDFTDEAVTASHNPWWVIAMYLVLAVAGIVSQTRASAVSGSMRQSWDAR